MKKLLAAICALCFLVLLSGVSSARAEEPTKEGHSEKSAEESPTQSIFKWVNLLLLLGAAGYMLKKPASEFFETRKREINSGLERARIAQEESARRMAEIEQRLGRLSSEIAAMRRKPIPNLQRSAKTSSPRPGVKPNALWISRARKSIVSHTVLNATSRAGLRTPSSTEPAIHLQPR